MELAHPKDDGWDGSMTPPEYEMVEEEMLRSAEVSARPNARRMGAPRGEVGRDVAVEVVKEDAKMQVATDGA